MIVELYLDYPNSQTFSESLENLISNFSLPGHCSKIQISDDGKYLFIVRGNTKIDINSYQIFEIWDVRNPSEPRLSDSYNWDQSIREIHLGHNSETVYLMGDHEILVFDIKDRSSISMKKAYKFLDKNGNIQHFTTSSDEKAGFIMIYQGDLLNVTFFDLSQSSPSIVGVSIQFNYPLGIPNCKLIPKDSKTLILILPEGFSIYDVSNLASPIQIASLPYGINEPDPGLLSPLLSPDKKTLYIESVDLNGFHKLRVYDVSVSKSPQFIGEKDLSKREGKAMKPGFSLSPTDLKSGFILQENSFLKLNVTNSKEIKITGIIRHSDNKMETVKSYIISPDSQTIYVCIENQIRIINVNLKYTLFLKQEKFLLGEKYSGKVAILNLLGTSSSDYNLVSAESYKITKLSLLNMKIAPNKVSVEITTSQLPSWINFDRDSDSLTSCGQNISKNG